MTLQEIGKAESWKQAFDTARRLLLEERLTAVAVVSESEYARGNYIASVLKEFERAMGSVDAVVSNLESMCPMLYKGARSFRLAHGTITTSHPFSNGTDWLLAIIYND